MPSNILWPIGLSDSPISHSFVQCSKLSVYFFNKSCHFRVIEITLSLVVNWNFMFRMRESKGYHVRKSPSQLFVSSKIFMHVGRLCWVSASKEQEKEKARLCRALLISHSLPGHCRAELLASSAE